MKLITVFLAFFIISINAYSQDFDKVTFEGEEYYLLPKEFEAHKTGMIDEYPNYINKYDLPDGKWIQFLPSMPQYPYVTGQYKNGLAEGTWEFYSIDWDDTTSYIYLKAEYKSGKKNGRQYYYNEPGVLLQIFDYKDDLYHGEFISYNVEGIETVNGKYMYGIPVGRWVFHDHSGNIMRIESYKELIHPDSIEYYSDKNRYQVPDVRVADYKDRQYDIEYIPSAEGLWTEYERDGTKKNEQHYENGLLKYVKEFYPNGKISSEGPCIAARDMNFPVKRSYDPDYPDRYIKTGTWYYYDINGDLLKTEDFGNSSLFHIDK